MATKRKPEWLTRDTEAVRVDKQGRCVIPAKLRRELGLLPDESLLAWADGGPFEKGGRLILASRIEAGRYLQAKVGKARKAKKHGR